MFIVLLALGVIVTVAGGGMTLFGVANNGFDIGNTMISAGMTGVVGGLIVIALANVARELRAAREPNSRRSSRPAAAPAPSAPLPAGRGTPPEKPPEAPATGDLSQVLAEPAAEAAKAEPRIEPTPSAPPPGDPFAPARADPARRAAARERNFDSVWAPDAAKPAAAAARPAPESPRPPDAPRAAEAPRESEAVAIRPTREAQAVTVLKSGVIEGMAYTLYSDGSIEADLPQGMMRFPSIDALRRHLAGQG
jgi:hypothetical protein